MCRSKSPPRVVSTKAPSMAGAQMISSLTSLDVLQHRVAVVDGLREQRISVGAEHDRIGPIDADETQLAQRLRDSIRILAHVGRQRHDRIARSLPDAFDLSRRIALEDGAVFGERDCRAASFAGCQSESFEPRSTSSICWRSSSKGTRSSTRGLTSRCRARIPSPGAAIS